jgi:hypothetical protein
MKVEITGGVPPLVAAKLARPTFRRPCDMISAGAMCGATRTCGMLTTHHSGDVLGLTSKESNGCGAGRIDRPGHSRSALRPLRRPVGRNPRR